MPEAGGTLEWLGFGGPKHLLHRMLRQKHVMKTRKRSREQGYDRLCPGSGMNLHKLGHRTPMQSMCWRHWHAHQEHRVIWHIAATDIALSGSWTLAGQALPATPCCRAYVKPDATYLEAQHCARAFKSHILLRVGFLQPPTLPAGCRLRARLTWRETWQMQVTSATGDF